MLFSDLIKGFAREIDPKSLRITAFPDIVWVFGGRTSAKSTKKFLSLRDLFLNRLYGSKSILAKFARIPESYEEWNTFDGYPDLLEFERDASYLAKATVIFCESPGAFAELGAFASDPHLCSHTIVVIQRSKRKQTSYINLGPIRRIERTDHQSICVIEADLIADFSSEVDLVIRAIEKKVNNAPKTELFQPTSLRDQFLLIADLIDLLQAITIDELLQVVRIFNVDIDVLRLRQLLNQLSLFELVAIDEVLTDKYLRSNQNGRSYVNYQAVQGLPPFDRTRYKADAFSLLKSDIERFRAFQLSRRRSA